MIRRRGLLLAPLCAPLISRARANTLNIPPPFLQPVINIPVVASFWNIVNSGAAHVLIPGCPCTGAGAATTSAAIDTTSATIIVIGVEYYQASGGPPTLSDSKANTWTQLTVQTGASSKVSLYYSLNPTVGSGHTFTLTNAFAGFYGTGQVLAFSGSATPGFTGGQQSGTVGSGATVQPGSITPGTTNNLVVTALGTGYNGVYSVSAPFSLTDQQQQGASTLGGATAWLSQSAATAVNPTWTATGTASPVDNNAVMAVFHP
jgi:hypothetical protein